MGIVGVGSTLSAIGCKVGASEVGGMGDPVIIGRPNVHGNSYADFGVQLPWIMGLSKIMETRVRRLGLGSFRGDFAEARRCFARTRACGRGRVPATAP